MKDFNFISVDEAYLFNQGEYFRSYERLGAHPLKVRGKEGTHFAVYAPNAQEVRVTGGFCDWSQEGVSLSFMENHGIWQGFVQGVEEGSEYKYLILGCDGVWRYKADPYAFYSSLRPKTNSVVYSLDGYEWKDQKWQEKQSTEGKSEQMLIYEIHLGSWRTKEDGGYYSYEELAKTLVPYVKSMGYNYVELLPIMEHPLDASWGYQVTGYYSVTSRYGEPKGLMSLIDRFHRAGIGVLLDWVPGHFCKDAQGLSEFDGQKLYEVESHEQWGTNKFDFARMEVRSFLISNALFWMDYFHVDGLRVDGVTSMLYWDFDKPCDNGAVNEEALSFLRKLNETVFHFYPNAVMIAEESSAWPGVTWPPYDNGLGFSYKWNMGWMNDTLKYMEAGFSERRNLHNLLTFSLTYAFSEEFILPLSHDEVVHGKKSILDKMTGDYWQKFAGLRTLYTYFITHPGKKLTFMGIELGQFIEWREYEQLDWLLLDYPKHREVQHFIKEMNALYKKQHALWEQDHQWNGFQWLDADNNEQSILIYIRQGKKARDFLIIALNFTPNYYPQYRIGVPYMGSYAELMNSDSIEFGGSGKINEDLIKSEQTPWMGQEQSVSIQMPPLAAVILKPRYISVKSKDNK